MPYRIWVSASTLASLAGTWGWVWVDAVGGAAMGGVVGDGGAAGRLVVQAAAASASSTASTTAPIRWRIAGGLSARGHVTPEQTLPAWWRFAWCQPRSEEHTSELESRGELVCRL